MKLLGLVMQNKKGENILMVSAPSFPTRFCAMYSHMIYQHILEVYSKPTILFRKQVEDRAHHQSVGKSILHLQYHQRLHSLYLYQPT